MAEPLVTVVIPVHNGAHEIGRALRSVCTQTYRNLEVIVVDDGSSDDLDKALVEFDSEKLTLIRHRHRRGAAAARNTGIGAANGAYVAFLDSDDEWLPEKLACQIDIMSASQAAARVTTTGFYLVRGTAYQSEIRLPRSRDTLGDLLWGCDLSPGSTMVAAREAFDDVGLFDERLERLEDWDWLMRYVGRGRIHAVPEPLARIYLTGWPRYDAVVRSTKAIERRHRGHIRALGTASGRKFRSSLALERAASAFREGRKDYATGHILHSLALWPFRDASFYRRLVERTVRGGRATSIHRPVPLVMHVITGLGVGGAEAVLTSILLRDRELQIQPVVVSLLPGGRMAEKLRQAGVSVIELNAKYDAQGLRALVRLARLIRAVKPDVVQGWMYHANIYALLGLVLSGRKGRTALFWGIRCSDMRFSDYGWRLRTAVWLGARLSRLPDGIIANSDRGREVHIRLGYDKRSFSVIRNGVDVRRFRPDAGARASVRSEFGLAEDRFVIAQVARRDPMKGYDVLVDAMRRVAQLTCLAVGRGTHKLPEIEGLMAIGERDDVPRLLSGIDVLISCSLYGEGSSNAILEAMATGVPVIATDVGDARALIGDGGIVIPPGDPSALVAAILRLQQDRDGRIAMGRRAYERCRANFSFPRMIDAFNGIYQAPVPDGKHARETKATGAA